jgi:hypothetical protein
LNDLFDRSYIKIVSGKASSAYRYPLRLDLPGDQGVSPKCSNVRACIQETASLKEVHEFADQPGRPVNLGFSEDTLRLFKTNAILWQLSRDSQLEYLSRPAIEGNGYGEFELRRVRANRVKLIEKALDEATPVDEKETIFFFNAQFGPPAGLIQCFGTYDFDKKGFRGHQFSYSSPDCYTFTTPIGSACVYSCLKGKQTSLDFLPMAEENAESLENTVKKLAVSEATFVRCYTGHLVVKKQLFMDLLARIKRGDAQKGDVFLRTPNDWDAFFLNVEHVKWMLIWNSQGQPLHSLVLHEWNLGE